MTPCGMMQRPGENLLETSFLEAWERVKETINKIITSNKCFNCKYRKSCQTCAASAFAETGKFDGCATYHCDFCKNYENMLKEHINNGNRIEK